MKKYSVVYFLFLSCVILADLSAFTTVKASVQAPFQSLLTNRETKYILPSQAQQNFQEQSFSIFAVDQNEFTHLPKGNILFAQDPSLAQQFDALITLFNAHPDFVLLCRKIHINVLLQLYNHLMKFFTTVNMYHPGSAQVHDDIVVHVQEYKSAERVYAVHKKALFVNMLMGLLEEQFNGTIQQLLPGVQPHQATVVGKVFIQADYGTDLTALLTQDVESSFDEKQQLYKTWLQLYFAFFESYTKYIERFDAHTGQSIFMRMAQTIHARLGEQDSFFFIQPDALPVVQTSLQKIRDIVHTQPLGWPEFIVQQMEKKVQGVIAQTGVQYPLAYGKDAKGNVVYEAARAKKLYIVMQEHTRLFEQELLKEPKWMRSAQGMQDVIKACFGNVVALTRKGILDPWTEALIQQVYKQ